MIVTLVGNDIFTTVTSITDISVTVPAGIMPGDYLLFALNTRGSTGATASTPAGFTGIIDIARSTLGRHIVFGKVADGTETTVTTTVAFSSNHAAILLLFRGVDATTPVNVSDAVFNPSSVADHVTPSVTTTVNGCFIVGFADAALVGSFDYTWAPGTSIVQAKSTISGIDNVLASAYLTQPIAGATATNTATMSSGSKDAVTSTVALAPVPGSGGLTGLSVLQGVNTLQF